MDYRDWNSDDRTETDYSDYEESEADIIDSIGSAIDDEFLTDEALPNSEQPVQINMVTDQDIWTVSDRKDNHGGRTLTGSAEDITSVNNSKMIDRPVMGSLPACAGTDTEEPLVMTVSSVCEDTDTGDIPVYNENSIPDQRRPVKVLPDVNTQVVKSDSHWNSRDCCFGMCDKADSVNRSGICLCWDFLHWAVWGYRVSCLTAIVIKD